MTGEARAPASLDRLLLPGLMGSQAGVPAPACLALPADMADISEPRREAADRPDRMEP